MKIIDESARIHEKILRGEEVTDAERRFVGETVKLVQASKDRAEELGDKADDAFRKLLMKVILPVAVGYFVVQRVLK